MCVTSRPVRVTPMPGHVTHSYGLSVSHLDVPGRVISVADEPTTDIDLDRGYKTGFYRRHSCGAVSV